MKQVASLQYGVIFKKAFSQPDIFTAFVEAVLGIRIEIEKVEMEKSFRPTVRVGYGTPQCQDQKAQKIREKNLKNPPILD